MPSPSPPGMSPGETIPREEVRRTGTSMSQELPGVSAFFPTEITSLGELWGGVDPRGDVVDAALSCELVGGRRPPEDTSDGGE
mmetsp:Transcript_25688/g.64761  ORF Transcript_25688/g.64761 Transcript_25688/m.64761 type:complete len:83 (+) Transcript_25688:2517-2765(+)